MTSYEIGTLIILGITAVIFLLQAGIAVRSLVVDHDRRKKEATIHYMNQIRPQYRELNDELIGKLGEGVIDDVKINAILQDIGLHAKVKDILGLFEHLAVGANAGVFDAEMLNRMSGAYLITIYSRYEQYFNRRRREANNPGLYAEYGKLVTTFKSLREE